MSKDTLKEQQKGKDILASCLASMEALSALMEREMLLVKERNVTALRALVQEKNKLMLEYRSGLKDIAQNPEIVRKAPPEMRGLLEAEGKRFVEVTAENERMLKTAVMGQRKLVETVYGAIRKEALPQQGYANFKKTRGRAEMNGGDEAPSVVISRSA